MQFVEKAAFKDFQNICITSNGIVKKDGRLVMGAGVAKYFRDKVKDLDLIAGMEVKFCGSYFRYLYTVNDSIWDNEKSVNLYLFPTKHDYREISNLDLIKESAKLLNEMCKNESIPKYQEILLPLPGCRNGGLSKEVVLPILESILKYKRIIVAEKISELERF